MDNLGIEDLFPNPELITGPKKFPIPRLIPRFFLTQAITVYPNKLFGIVDQKGLSTPHICSYENPIDRLLLMGFDVTSSSSHATSKAALSFFPTIRAFLRMTAKSPGAR
jgi:hypothetical protein